MIHIAGLDVQVGPRLRQRCGWCGVVLIDVDVSTIAVEEGSDPTHPTWIVGDLVDVEGGVEFPVDHIDGEPLPDGCCATLDPEVTL